MTSREERLQQRMRGAGIRDDASTSLAPLFVFSAPAIGPSASPEPSISRLDPNSSTKRRRSDQQHARTSDLRDGSITAIVADQPGAPRAIELAGNPDVGKSSQSSKTQILKSSASSPASLVSAASRRKSARHVRGEYSTLGNQAQPILSNGEDEDELLSSSPLIHKSSRGNPAQSQVIITDHTQSVSVADRIVVAHPSLSLPPGVVPAASLAPKPSSKSTAPRRAFVNGQRYKDTDIAEPYAGAGADASLALSRVPIQTPNAAAKSATARLSQEQANSQYRKSKPIKRSTLKQPARTKTGIRPRSRHVDRDADHPISVIVQRFRRPAADDDVDKHDTLAHRLASTNRIGPNVVDVLVQLCDEVIDATLLKLENKLNHTEQATEKRILKIKCKALDAYRVEIKSQFLEHTIALNALYAQRKRIRAVHKHRAGLRDRILELRAEREHVALRMDAVRAKHEYNKRQALYHIDLSSAMHDVDLAIDQGMNAPELTSAEDKLVGLSNCDFHLARVRDHVSNPSSKGGMLSRIRDFNAFLERTIAAL